MTLNILHLSDLHIGRDGLNMEDLACSISIPLGKLGDEKIGQIVVTGDIFDAILYGKENDDDLFSLAKTFFTTLIKKINAIQELSLTKKDILFVPGNHEIEQNLYKKETPSFSAQSRVVFGKFERFLNSFYGKSDKTLKAYNMEHLSVFKKFEEEKVIIIGFNSASCDGKKNFGHIEIQHITDIAT